MTRPIVEVRNIGRNGVIIAGTIVLRPESISPSQWLKHWELYKRLQDEGFKFQYDDGHNTPVNRFP